MTGGNVTHENDEENGNKAHNKKVNDQDNTKIDGGNITQIIDVDEGTRAHNDMANGQDNIKVNGGDVTLVIDEGKGRKAHKKTFEDKFNKPKRKPNNLGERKMIGKAITVTQNF